LKFTQVQGSLLIVEALFNKGRGADIDDFEKVIEALVVGAQVLIFSYALQLVLPLLFD
jgi:hypothetical protein